MRVALGLILIGLALVAPVVLVQLFSPDGSIEPDSREALRSLQGLLVVSAAILIVAGPVFIALRRFAAAVGAKSSDSPTQSFLVFALLIPWVALLILVEPGRSDRLWWLWPLIAIFLAALVVHVVGASTFGRRIVAVALGGLFLCLAWVTPANIARVQSWAATGWAGTDADEIRAVGYIASRVTSPGAAHVGYHLDFFRGIPTLSAIDPRFKVGAELDFVLSYRYGIINMSRCPEGLNPDDEFRLADEGPSALRPGMYHLVASPGVAFREVRRFGRVRVLEHLDPKAP